MESRRAERERGDGPGTLSVTEDVGVVVVVVRAGEECFLAAQAAHREERAIEAGALHSRRIEPSS